jgi:hypothetical protein
MEKKSTEILSIFSTDWSKFRTSKESVRMFRLTVDGAQVVKPRSAMSSKKIPQKQRVYRWENCWGFALPGTSIENAWFAERRIPETFGIATDGTKFLLERVEPLYVDAPPLKVDDIWEEEVILLGQGGMVTKSLSVTGSKTELIEFAVRNGFSLPLELLAPELLVPDLLS